ncbi:hybrid sensor histidine kinase/response regulator, partial [Singulisphaera rosea]
GVGPTANGWLAAPLVGRNGKNMGLIQLADKKDGEFDADDEAILVQLSQLAAIAIQNARLNEELKINDERKNEFLAMLAHELRNPLAAIGNAVKLTEKSEGREQVDWSMGVITRQTQHLSRLIDDLMDVSRITQGKIRLRRDVIEVSPILESAAATVGPLIEERKHTLELEHEPGDLWVNADPTRLEQVVVNLLNNAAKYSENGGHIRLSARKDRDEVVISVKDRGVGIPPEKLPEMFELFAQGDRSLARSEGGLGIGLTVVRKLVELHGGSIVASSEGVGRGSEFLIRLPLTKTTASMRSTPGGQAEHPVKKLRILIVDDSVDTARGMARLLKLLGHEIETAHNGMEGIEAAREQRPNFIMLDIGLPGMSGYEVASQLRREACCKDAVIIAVSGYGQDEDRRRSKSAGFDFHLTKPVDYDALLALLSAGANGQA